MFHFIRKKRKDFHLIKRKNENSIQDRTSYSYTFSNLHLFVCSSQIAFIQIAITSDS